MWKPLSELRDFIQGASVDQDIPCLHPFIPPVSRNPCFSDNVDLRLKICIYGTLNFALLRWTRRNIFGQLFVTLWQKIRDAKTAKPGENYPLRFFRSKQNASLLPVSMPQHTQASWTIQQIRESQTARRSLHPRTPQFSHSRCLRPLGPSRDSFWHTSALASPAIYVDYSPHPDTILVVRIPSTERWRRWKGTVQNGCKIPWRRSKREEDNIHLKLEKTRCWRWVVETHVCYSIKWILYNCVNGKAVTFLNFREIQDLLAEYNANK